MHAALFAGVNAAALTAFNQDLSINYHKTVQHALTLIEQGCNGLAVLGTTGEANSLSLWEREQLLQNLVDGGIAPRHMLPGTGTPDIPSTVRLIQHAERLGCRGVLLLPPFYYKNPSLEGLERYFSEVIVRAGGDIGIYLYHFPQQSAVPITLPLIERLLIKFPGKIKGIKDSSGDLHATQAYIDNFAAAGFEVYSGADTSFQQILALGGAGCITATTNIAATLSQTIYTHRDRPQGVAAQRKLTAIRQVVALADTIPTVKTLKAYLCGDDDWHHIRPPLSPLSAAVRHQVISAYRQLITPEL